MDKQERKTDLIYTTNRRLLRDDSRKRKRSTKKGHSNRHTYIGSKANPSNLEGYALNKEVVRKHPHRKEK